MVHTLDVGKSVRLHVLNEGKAVIDAPPPCWKWMFFVLAGQECCNT